MPEMCSHKVESENPLVICLYCIPCEVELHSHEAVEAHESHHKISLDEFNSKGYQEALRSIKPQHPTTALAAESHLTVQQVLDKSRRSKEFIEAMTYEEIMAYINFLALAVQQIKEDQLLAHKHKAKLEITLEGDVIERARAANKPKQRASTTARISKQEKAYESMALMLGISIDEAKKMVLESKGGQVNRS